MEKLLTSFILLTLGAGILIPPAGYLSALGVLILFIALDKAGELSGPIILNRPFLIFILAVFMSVLFSNIPASSAVFFILAALQYSYYSMAIYYLKHKGIRSMFDTLNYFAIIASVLGIYQFLTGKLEINRHWAGYSESLSSLSRIYSTLYNPNVFAAYLVINICFIISWILYVKKEPLKEFSLILCSIALILTYSRGAFVSLIIAVLIIYVLIRDKRILLYAVVMLMFFILLNNGAGYERIDVTKINNDSSSIYRLEIWRTSYEIFLQNPIAGNGIGTLWFSLSHVSPKLWGTIYHAHNLFLHFAAENGILGLLAFINICIRTFVSSWRTIRNSYDSFGKFAALGAVGSCTAIVIHGMIDAVIVIPTMTLILMNYYGMASYALQNKQIEN